MVGTSCDVAPWPRRRSAISPACSLVRGTRTFQPYSARDSHHDSFDRCPAAWPIVTISGPTSSPASFATFSSVVSRVRWVLMVPFAVTATGVAAGTPLPVSADAASARCADDACSTSGPGAAASAAQSTSPRTSTSVCVPPSATPAYAGTAAAGETPGMTSNTALVRATAWTSATTAGVVSGSPAISRSTSRPALASVVRSLATSVASPTAGRTSAPSAAMASTACGTSGSVTTTSALASSSWARTVSRPASPGPEPTNATRPVVFRAGVICAFLLLRRPCAVARTQGSPTFFEALARALLSRAGEGSGSEVQQLGGQVLAQLGGLALVGQCDGPDHVHRTFLALDRGGAAQRDPFHDLALGVEIFDDLGERAHRRAAPRLERGQQGPLGRHRGPRALVVQCGREQLLEVHVGGPALHRQRTLCGRGQHLDRVEGLGDHLDQSDPGQSGTREHHGIELAVGDLAHAGVDIAANRHDFQTETQRTQLRGAPRRARAHRRTRRQLTESQPVPRDERVPRVRARRHGGQRNARLRRRRQVLVRVDDDVDLVAQQGFPQRRREDADPDRGNRRGGLVTGSGHLDDFDLGAGGAQ